MMLYCIGPSPKSSDWCPHEERSKSAETHTKEGPVKMAAEPGRGDVATSQGTPTVGGTHQQPGEGPGAVSPLGPPEGAELLPT